MSNRTDWPELVDELLGIYAPMGRFRTNAKDPSGSGFRDRLALELHNAFVAGQECQEKDAGSVEVRLTQRMRDQLAHLVEDGYHGADIEEAAARMLAKQLEGTQTASGGGSSRAVGFALGGYRRTKRDQPRHIQPGEAPYLPFRTPKMEDR